MLSDVVVLVDSNPRRSGNGGGLEPGERLVRTQQVRLVKHGQQWNHGLAMQERLAMTLATRSQEAFRVHPPLPDTAERLGSGILSGGESVWKRSRG